MCHCDCEIILSYVRVVRTRYKRICYGFFLGADIRTGALTMCEQQLFLCDLTRIKHGVACSSGHATEKLLVKRIKL